ncbi:hypothetical protein BGP77_06305 [Saccharospirillum sp. MSK14-1]|uniref:DUF4864 domain-containing protein n=1 Tax=Saccharospirillum sp. MSK14-1 TaxID=1897632 RepID=UPI000D342BF2|nr:DUF4864 domain-containing protein [Saccharospirillum sp. MSK14-1]PTY36892.1 hypothetical protein BGP77_06305 [Saccharospirillum sp. MSK14-1]
MRSLLLLLLCCQLLAAGVQAEDSDNALEDQFRNLITQQLSALRSGDAEAAWAWAHPNIKGRFLTADRFYTMIARQYQPLTEFSVIRFRELEAAGDNWMLPVWLRTDDDQQYLAVYVLSETNQGEWRIAGCQLAEYQPPGI